MSLTKLDELQRQVAKLDSISTAPVALQPLLELLHLPARNVPFEKVVELVSYDGAIAAQCLRLANSPLFGKTPGRDSPFRRHNAGHTARAFGVAWTVHEPGASQR
jgi:hypothetical protein